MQNSRKIFFECLKNHTLAIKTASNFFIWKILSNELIIFLERILKEILKLLEN